jgi:hypothetical protein
MVVIKDLIGKSFEREGNQSQYRNQYKYSIEIDECFFYLFF